MRPLTKAVFEKEKDHTISQHWTLEQTKRAYEIADDLLNYIATYKAKRDLKHRGIPHVSVGFKSGLKKHLAKDEPDERLQMLSLNILAKLLDKGLEVMAKAVEVYRNTPGIFKEVYASSKPAFMKDKFFREKVPDNSFIPFKSGENPAITQDENLSQLCTMLYQNDTIKDPCISWLCYSRTGSRMLHETTWIQHVAQDIYQEKIRTPIENRPLAAMLNDGRE